MCHWEFRKSGYLYIGVGPYTNFGFEAFFKEGGRKENLYKTGKGAGVPAMKDSSITQYLVMADDAFEQYAPDYDPSTFTDLTDPELTEALQAITDGSGSRLGGATGPSKGLASS